jgi:hypothetical protein
MRVASAADQVGFVESYRLVQQGVQLVIGPRAVTGKAPDFPGAVFQIFRVVFIIDIEHPYLPIGLHAGVVREFVLAGQYREMHGI